MFPVIKKIQPFNPFASSEIRENPNPIVYESQSCCFTPAKSNLVKIYESNSINPNYHAENKKIFDELENKIDVLVLLIKFKYARKNKNYLEQNIILEKLKNLFAKKQWEQFNSCLALVKNKSRYFPVALPNTFQQCILEAFMHTDIFVFEKLKHQLTNSEYNFIKEINPIPFEFREIVLKMALEEKNNAPSNLLKGVDTDNVKLIKRALLAGAGINKLDEEGRPPLSRAIMQNSLKAVPFFLKQKGIEENKPDKDGFTPLHTAVNVSCTKSIALLLQEDHIDANKPDHNGLTSLHRAVDTACTESIQLLLDYKDIEVNKPDNNGFTPLHRALDKGYTEIIQLLLAHNYIDVKKCDHNGATPLDIGLRKADKNIVNLFVPYKEVSNGEKTNVNVTLSDFKIAFAKKRDIEFFTLLIRKMNFNSIDHESAVIQCCYLFQRYDVMKLLICEKKINLPQVFYDDSDAEDFRPSHTQSLEEAIKALKFLLAEPSINVNEENKYGYSLIHLFTVCNGKELLELVLLHPKININRRVSKCLSRPERMFFDSPDGARETIYHSGKTALQLAAQYSTSPEIFKLLLFYNNINKLNQKGHLTLFSKEQFLDQGKKIEIFQERITQLKEEKIKIKLTFECIDLEFNHSYNRLRSAENTKAYSHEMDAQNLLDIIGDYSE